MAKAQVPAKRGGREIATVDEAELYKGADSAASDFDRDDIAIPRLVILQTGSPQVQTRENTYVEGAEPSMIFDAVGAEMWDGEEGVVILPIHYRRTYVEWITREAGSGFVSDHGLTAGKELLTTTTRDDKGRDILPNGNQLNNTLEYVVYRLTPEGKFQCIINMGSTQLKKGRNWNPNIMKPLPGGVPAPFYARAFRFTTIPESNDKGNWFGWKIIFEHRLVELPQAGYKWVDVKTLNDECAEFRKLLVEDKIRFSPPTANVAEEGVNPDAL